MKFPKFRFEKEGYSEEEGYSEDEWLTVSIAINSPYSELIRVKKYLKPYAEELGWDITQEDINNDEDENKVNIILSPELEERFSLEELSEDWDKIVGFAYSIYRDLMFNGDNKKTEEANKSALSIMNTKVEGEETRWFIKISYGFLSLEYLISDMVKAEKDNPEMVEKILPKNTEETLKLLYGKPKKKMTKKELEYYNNNKKFREELKERFGFDI